VKFEWDADKEQINLGKHGVDFDTASRIFSDPRYFAIPDKKHSDLEPRFLGFGCVDGHILTVRFVVRGKVIRIFGAGEWRKGRKIYEEKNID
jgi:uncharacterized protein